MTFLDRYAGHAYALLRIIAGLMFLNHGLQKFFGFPMPFPMALSPLLTAAGVIELVCGTLIAIGLFARPAAFIASGMCAVGFWMMHAPQGILPIANGGETIVLYCFVFLMIATRGAGMWSVEAATAKAD